MPMIVKSFRNIASDVLWHRLFKHVDFRATLGHFSENSKIA
jgi:hypothetical protein